MPRNSPEDSPTYRYTERERKREKEKEKALIDGEKTENQQRRRNHSTFVSLRYTLYINKNSDEVHGLLWMMFTFLRVFPFFFYFTTVPSGLSIKFLYFYFYAHFLARTGLLWHCIHNYLLDVFLLMYFLELLVYFFD